MRLTAQPAYYARVGTVAGDLITLLHLPYTAWHLSYVAMGAALAGELDWLRFLGAMIAFFAGTGISVHALDELHGRPLGTDFSDTTLLALAGLGFAIAGTVTIAGMLIVSPWVILWAIAGTILAMAYALEWWNGLVHSELGFALAWGAFPVLMSAWAQVETITAPIILIAIAAALLALVQRALSTPSRQVRRRTYAAAVTLRSQAGDERWNEEQLLATWEQPLRYLTWFIVVLASGVVLAQL